MFSKKTARVAVWWLLAIFSIFSFISISCDLSEAEVNEPLTQIEGGMLSNLRIAGKSAEFKEPERKSNYYLSLDEVEKKLYDAAYTTLSSNKNSFKLIGIDIGSFAAAYRSTLIQFINDCPEFFWLDGYVEYETVRASNSDKGHITITFGVFWKIAPSSFLRLRLPAEANCATAPSGVALEL